MFGTQSSIDSLFAIAEVQQGYFTAKQATQVGYKLGSQAYHVKAGNWVRMERGIYRLARFPQSDEEQLVIYSFWSRNRAGRSEGVYSHQTALSIHELTDTNPAKLHMTVPPEFRRTAKVPTVLILHRARLAEKDVEERDGFAVVRPLQAIIEVANNESVSRDSVAEALTEARQRGLITANEIEKFRQTQKPAGWLAELLSNHKA